MAKRREKNDIEGVAWFLAIGIFGIIYLIKWTIELIVWIFSVISKGINKISKKREEKIIMNNSENNIEMLYSIKESENDYNKSFTDEYGR